MRSIIFIIVSAFVTLGMYRTIGQFRLMETEPAIMVLGSLCIVGFLLFVKNSLSRPEVLTLATFLALFLYSIATSRYVGVSLIFAYYALCAAMLFVILNQAVNSADESNALASVPQAEEKAQQTNHILDSAKLAFIYCIGLHAIVLIVFYIYKPVRTFGLMDDYSQASMVLLLAFGMAYPRLRNSNWLTPFSLVVFIGYFTTFSRTANFLFVFFFLGLFVYEFINGRKRIVVRLATLAALSFVMVYLYPLILEEATVSRGGLAHLSTLNSRTLYFEAAWNGILQSPYWGHGLGTYAWTGIKEMVPFNNIYFVHNDYLQIWHDLGVFWSILLFGSFFVILIRKAPLAWQGRPKLTLSTMSVSSLVAWLLLVSIALYMSINFLIVSLEFQVAIVILLVDLLRK